MMRFINDDGRCFITRLVRKADYYGDNNSLIYQAEEPSIEFFDATGIQIQRTLGYFTGIHCKISTLFVKEIDLATPINEHLWVWNISETNIEEIKIWLLTQLNETEKQFIDLTQIHRTKIPRPPDEKVDTEMTEDDVIFNEIDTIENEIVPENLPVISHNHFLQQQLIIAMQALDLAEKSEENWQQGQVQLRLRILTAKKNVLRALALLTS